jgi:hypothetical protein
MSKYVLLKNRMNSYIKAASRAEDSFMIAFWTESARRIEEQINKMPLSEAMEEIKR